MEHFKTSAIEWVNLFRQGKAVLLRFEGVRVKTFGASRLSSCMGFGRKPRPQVRICGKIKTLKSVYTASKETAHAAMAMKKSIHSLIF